MDRKEYLKQYYCNHREKMLTQLKNNYEMKHEEKIEAVAKYREVNKDDINKKHICQCGGHYTTVNKSKHEQTKKHTYYLINKYQQ